MADGYLTENGRWKRWPLFTYGLIAANVIIYCVLEWVHWHAPIQTRMNVDYRLMLHENGLRQGYYWEFITFQFLHAHLKHHFTLASIAALDLPWHLILNCWGIFVFGPPLEAALGRVRVAVLYLVSGVAGGALQIFAALISSDHFGGMVAGASAGLFGLIAAFTMVFPEARMLMLLFFVIPVRMTAKRLLTFAAVVTVAGMMFARMFPNWVLGAQVAHAAHLGGLIAGLVMVRLFDRQVRMFHEGPGSQFRPLG